MCGLVGAFAQSDREPGELAATIAPAIAMMARRGPDDEGAWSDRRCALGFRRLAILDLSPTGHQPMITSDGRYVLVFNGEIYNFRELRDQLSDPASLRSTGDSEVLLRLLVDEGPEALRRVNGMFAFALYDSVERRLLVARDHAGIKPLHFAKTARGFVFGSQYDQVLAHPWMDGAVDLDALSLYLRFGFVPAPFGLHRGAGQLAAGTWMEIASDGGTRTGTFFEFPRRSRVQLRGDEAVDAFDEVFARAVRRHLVSDVPVGVLLSGGVDSPLVAAEARRQHAGSLQAFTIAVDDPRLDESDDARAFASELGIDQVVERISTSDALALVGDVITAATEPTADHSMFPTLLVSRVARRHVKVVLSGDGGDELFWGYPSRFGPAIAQARYFALPRMLRVPAVAARRVGCGAATREILDHATVGDLYRKKHTLIAETDLRELFPTVPPPDRFQAFTCDSTDPDEVAQWVRWNEFEVHLARVLAKVDRASMFHSLEVRVPLLDREVIEVACRTDWRSCLDLETRRGKRVLRTALARRVRHHTSTKKGFAVPMRTWLLGPLAPLVHDHLLERTELLGVPFNARIVHRMMGALRGGDQTKAWGLWSLLSLALWHRKHVEHETCT